MKFPTSHAFQQELPSPPLRSFWLCSRSWWSSHSVFSFLIWEWCCIVGVSLFLLKLLFFIITLLGFLFCQNFICDLIHVQVYNMLQGFGKTFYMCCWLGLMLCKSLVPLQVGLTIIDVFFKLVPPRIFLYLILKWGQLNLCSLPTFLDHVFPFTWLVNEVRGMFQSLFGVLSEITPLSTTSIASF